MSRPSFLPQRFASGLEGIGSLDWDAEYEELIAADDSKQQPEPEIQEVPRTALPAEVTTVTPSTDEEAPIHGAFVDSTTVHAAPIARSPNWTCISDTLVRDYEDLSEYSSDAVAAAPTITEANNTTPFEDPFLSWEHPGWTWEESQSWYEWTVTSPEVCAWFNSPGIYDDAAWVVGASKLGDDYAHNDIPRVASVLRRAYRETYAVPEKAGVMFPPLARGYKDFSRRESKGPLEMYRRGCKGLKAVGDSEIAVMIEWFPNGETKVSSVEMPGVLNFFPQPSRLNQMWNTEEMVVEGIPAAISAEIDELFSSDGSDGDWDNFGDSSEDEGGGRPLVDSFNTSMDSVASCPADNDSCELFNEPSAVAPTIKLPSTPTIRLIPSPTIKLITPPSEAQEPAAQASGTTIHTSEPPITIIPDSDSESDASFAEEGEEVPSDWEGEEDSYVSESEYATSSDQETNLLDASEEPLVIQHALRAPNRDEDEGSIASDGENTNTSEDNAASPHISSTGPIITLHPSAKNEGSENDEDSVTASSNYPTSEDGEDEATPRPMPPANPAITLHPATDSEDGRSDDDENQPTPAPANPEHPLTPTRLQELSPKLTGPGRSRTSSVLDTSPPPSPCLLSPALALRDAGAGRRLEPARTLWRGYVEEYGGIEGGGSGEESTWGTKAAAVVAVVGGLVAFLA